MPKEPRRQRQNPKKEDIKKPQNAFILFANQNREAVRRTCDVNTSHTDLQKLLAEKWARLPKSEQRKYQEEYERSVAEYRERYPGRKFKRSPNKQPEVKNTKSSKHRKTTKSEIETHRLDFPDLQTVFRVESTEVEVVSEGDRQRKH